MLTARQQFGKAVNSYLRRTFEAGEANVALPLGSVAGRLDPPRRMTPTNT
jgi:hypothetical protein